GALHAYQDGAGYDAVAYVQFFDAWDAGNGLHVVVVESVAHMEAQAVLSGILGGLLESFQFALPVVLGAGFGITGGLNLDRLGAQELGSLDLEGIGIDKESHLNAGSS